MPFHLPPVSRRRFLGSALAAGLGLWTARPVSARAVAADRWVLLADTHIAADRALVARGINMTDHLTRVVTALTALDPRPAGVVLDGDVAYHRGEVGDYAQAAGLLQPLSQAGLPVHLTLGNHDHRAHIREGLLRGSGRSPLESRQVAVVEAARANWFLLDSLDRVNGTPGELGEEQLRWLAGALDARPGKPALVVVHHDPQWSPAVLRTGLVDTERLWAVLAGRPQVKALIFGHTHRWHRERREGIHLINLPPVAYVFNQGMPSGWVEARLGERGAVLTLHTLDAGHRQNGETVELTWR
jgi:3',5'-cyclic AMP phosphodiesterase CpdA